MEAISLRILIGSLLWAVGAFIFMPESKAEAAFSRRLPGVLPAGSLDDTLEAVSVPEAVPYVFKEGYKSRAVLSFDSEKYKPHYPAEAVREIPFFAAGAFNTQYRTVRARRRGAVAFVEEFLQSSIPVRAAPVRGVQAVQSRSAEDAAKEENRQGEIAEERK